MTVDVAVQIAGVLGAPAVIAFVVISWLSRRMKSLDKGAECRRKENILILRGLFSIGGLAHATAEAVKEGYANGNVTSAMENYTAYKNDLQAYLLEQNADRK